jgi:hypothetical protein
LNPRSLATVPLVTRKSDAHRPALLNAVAGIATLIGGAAAGTDGSLVKKSFKGLA